jgi:hypothetical protein
MGTKRNAYGVLVGKSEGRRPLERHRHGLQSNIKMDMREREHGVIWNGLIWLRIGTGEWLL